MAKDCDESNSTLGSNGSVLSLAFFVFLFYLGMPHQQPTNLPTTDHHQVLPPPKASTSFWPPVSSFHAGMKKGSFHPTIKRC